MIDHQLRHNDCGISAVKTVCNILDADISREAIKQGIPLDQRGATIGSMAKFLNKEGFETNYKLLDFNDISTNASELKSWLPCIIPIKSSGELHYIVLKDLKKGKFVVLDPASIKEYKLSVQELKNKAHFASTYLNYADLDAKIKLVVSTEFKERNINLPLGQLTKTQLVEVFNKLSYVSYISETFGFKDKEAENGFLKDLIFNQELTTIPKHFKTLALDDGKIEIKAPLLLSVKKNNPINPKKADDEEEESKNLYWRLFKSITGIKELWYIFVATTIIASIITYLAVFVNQILIDHILPSYQMNVLILFAIGLTIFELFATSMDVFEKYLYIHLGNTFDRYFLSVFDSRLNTHSIRFLQSFRRGDLSERLSDSLRIKSFFMRYFSKIFVNLLVALLSISILIAINWKLSMIVFVVIGLFTGLFFIITPQIKKLERKRFRMKADLFSKFIEKIDGLQVIKSLKLEEYSTREIAAKVNALIDVQTKSRYVNLFNSTASSLIITIFSLIIIVFLSRDMILYNTITLGQIITFSALSGKIFSACKRLLDANLSIQEHQVILNRFFDFEKDTTKKAVKHTNTQNLIKDFELEEIRLKNISFSYVPDNPVLDGVNLNLRKGDKIWIQGKNGSGKSTLCKIISYLYEPEEGTMNINGISGNMYDSRELMSKVALVTNDDIIFNDTILFNITFGRPIDLQQIIEYTKVLNLYDFIDGKAEKFDFIVHENGRNLSTGQRKKLLLLRALLSDGELIILDEIFFGMDKESKRNAEQIIDFNNDKTFIIISHEEVQHIYFNQKYQLKDGKLLEYGQA